LISEWVTSLVSEFGIAASRSSFRSSEVNYRLGYDRYRRSFKQPLQTNHGIWSVREGVIITLQDQAGAITQGEIAPLEWFGSESLAEALEFCQALNGQISTEQIFQIPDRLPCCQFAFEMALMELEGFAESFNPPKPAQITALLPTGKAALTAWQPYYQAGDRSFKWKIGVNPIDDEIQLFQQLHQQLPTDCQIRLDANAGLNLSQTEQWLEQFEEYSIEYLEQPLPPNQFSEMQILSNKYQTKIALDESISNLQSLQDCYHKDWQGVYVIKPAIVGSPQKLQQFLQGTSIDVVFSSVFETEIGYQAGLRLAQKLGSQRALGYGTNKYWI
jgi:o-succinylbenzoate synthase